MSKRNEKIYQASCRHIDNWSPLRDRLKCLFWLSSKIKNSSNKNGNWLSTKTFWFAKPQSQIKLLTCHINKRQNLLLYERPIDSLSWLGYLHSILADSFNWLVLFKGNWGNTFEDKAKQKLCIGTHVLFIYQHAGHLVCVLLVPIERSM